MVLTVNTLARVGLDIAVDPEQAAPRMIISCYSKAECEDIQARAEAAYHGLDPDDGA